MWLPKWRKNKKKPGHIRYSFYGGTQKERKEKATVRDTEHLGNISWGELNWTDQNTGLFIDRNEYHFMYNDNGQSITLRRFYHKWPTFKVTGHYDLPKHDHYCQQVTFSLRGILLMLALPKRTTRIQSLAALRFPFQITATGKQRMKKPRGYWKMYNNFSCLSHTVGARCI